MKSIIIIIKYQDAGEDRTKQSILPQSLLHCGSNEQVNIIHIIVY